MTTHTSILTKQALRIITHAEADLGRLSPGWRVALLLDNMNHITIEDAHSLVASIERNEHD